MKLTPDMMYDAVLSKNPDFEGIFWMGVKTTGIFCRPTCTARKPKRKNTVFFQTTKEALNHGFRPCKICRPLEYPDTAPEEIRKLLIEISQHPATKIKDKDLLQKGLEPVTVRRWFLKNHGMTFHAFQRLLQLNTAFKKLQQGESVTEAALESGYESLSGFGEGFKSAFGVAPHHYKNEKIIYLKRIETPLGTMIACARESGICMLEFSDRKSLAAELEEISRYFGAHIIPGESSIFATLEEELHEYFNGERKTFSVSLSPVGTDFQKKVWEVLMKIPYGTTTSYREQAKILGNPKAVRAVANANGLNKISILIPCHRIIGSNGTLTGYGGGIWRKQKLLELEKAILI